MDTSTDIDYARLIQKGHRLRSEAVLSTFRRLWAALNWRRTKQPASRKASSCSAS